MGHFVWGARMGVIVVNVNVAVTRDVFFNQCQLFKEFIVDFRI